MTCDIIAPDFDRARPSRSDEHRLLEAVLVQALEDAREGSPDALAWLRASDAQGPGLSFAFVAWHLGLDPDAVRARLGALMGRDRSRRRAA